jgi:hypothetical protein
VSAEHVQNVLARLAAKPMSLSVEMALQVVQPPRADVARYDRLRTVQEMQEAGHA